MSLSDTPLPVWVNGRLMSATDPAITVQDFGLLYGEGLFETMRARGGRIAYLDRHFTRLRESAALIGLPLPGEEEMRQGLRVLLSEFPGEERIYRVRLTVSRGCAGPFDRPTVVSPTVFILASPSTPPSSSWSAVWSPYRRDEAGPLSRVKSTCYLPNVMAKRYAVAEGVEEALFLNTRGEIAEGSVSNLFLLNGEWLATPPEDSGLLPGILRSVLLDRAAEIGLQAEEKPLSPDDLYGADAAFLTNSVMGVVPLVKIGGREIGGGRPHPKTEILRSLLWRPGDDHAP